LAITLLSPLSGIRRTIEVSCLTITLTLSVSSLLLFLDLLLSFAANTLALGHVRRALLLLRLFGETRIHARNLVGSRGGRLSAFAEVIYHLAGGTEDVLDAPADKKIGDFSTIFLEALPAFQGLFGFRRIERSGAIHRFIGL
jgi:hypothetical protein